MPRRPASLEWNTYRWFVKTEILKGSLVHGFYLLYDFLFFGGFRWSTASVSSIQRSQGTVSWGSPRYCLRLASARVHHKVLEFSLLSLTLHSSKLGHQDSALNVPLLHTIFDTERGRHPYLPYQRPTLN